MKWHLSIVLLCICLVGYAQCDIKAEVQPNGTVHKVTKKELLYVTSTYTLFSAAIYDGGNYFFKLVVRPMFFKKVQKEQIVMQLTNGTQTRLDFYDARRVKKDSAMDILFEINEQVLEQLTRTNIKAIYFAIDTGIKKCGLVDHGGLLKRQLTCLVEDSKEKE